MQIRVCLETLMSATIPLIIAGCLPPTPQERPPEIVHLSVTPDYICPNQKATIQWLVDGGRFYRNKNIMTYLEIQELDGRFSLISKSDLTEELQSSISIDVAKYWGQELFAPQVRLSIEDRTVQPVKMYDEKTTFMSIQLYCEPPPPVITRPPHIKKLEVNPDYHCPKKNTVILWEIDQGGYQAGDIITRLYLQEAVSFVIDKPVGDKKILIEDYFIDEPLPNVIVIRLEINAPGKFLDEKSVAIANQAQCSLGR